MSEAEQLESPFGAIDYGVTEKQLKQLAARFSNITAIEDRDSWDEAKRALAELIRARTSIEKRRKHLKAESLEFGRNVDATAKQLMAVTEPEEERIRELVEAVKAKKAAEKAERERIEQERVDAINDLIQGIVLLPGTLQRAASNEVLEARNKLETLVVDAAVFAEFVEQAAEAKAAVIEQLNELYAGALHDEKIAEEERKRKEQEDADRALEDARLKAEREELEAKQRAIDEENQRKADELRKQQEAIEAERQAIEDAKRAEGERQEQERLAKEKAEAAEKDEKERLEYEAKVRPDREKLLGYIQAIDELECPEVSDEFAATANWVSELVASAIQESRKVLTEA